MTLPTPITILIVEDELIAAESLKLDLERKGYTIAGIADSGEKAVEMARHTRPDLILMDIMLKGHIDGIQASQMIRQDCEVPIIYITAFSNKSTIDRASNLGEPLYYLVKPVRLKTLLQTITQALEHVGLTEVTPADSETPTEETLESSLAPWNTNAYEALEDIFSTKDTADLV